MASYTVSILLILLLWASQSWAAEVMTYFYLKAQLHNMVIEVMYRDRTCGALVGTNWQQEVDNQHQLWYAGAGTLQSKLNNFCLEQRKDGFMVVAPCLDGDVTQAWGVNAGRIQHGANSSSVLQVADADMRARIQVSAFGGKVSQAWSSPDSGTAITLRPTSESPVPAVTTETRTFFFIKSKANLLVASIKDKNPLSGAEVVMWSQFSVDNAYQLWYEDSSTGILKNKLNGYCLTTTPLGLVVVSPCSGCATNQNWHRVGEFCQNGDTPDWVLDISGYNLSKGVRMSSYKYHGGDNQRWIFEACTAQRCKLT